MLSTFIKVLIKLKMCKHIFSYGYTYMQINIENEVYARKAK